MAPPPGLFLLNLAPNGELVVLVKRHGVDEGKGASAKGPQEWLRRALAHDELVCMSAAPDCSVVVVVGEAFLRKAELPDDVEVARHWWALRLEKDALGSCAAHGALASLLESLCEAGIDPRCMSSLDAELLLLRAADLPAAGGALVKAGHAVRPADRFCSHLSAPSPGLLCKSERCRSFAGAWCLVRRERPAGGKVEDFAEGEGPIRIQAACGLFAEVCVAARSASRAEVAAQETSCAGCLEVAEGAGTGATATARHRLVDFQPPTGEAPHAALTLDGEMLQEIGLPGVRYRETWARVDPSQESVALELMRETPERSTSRQGCWLFCGTRFARVLGLPRGQGVVSGTCCGSLRQLQRITGDGSVQKELAAHYEAVCGTVERPGFLRVGLQSRASRDRPGPMLLDAESGEGGTIINEGAEIIHRRKDGSEQTWRVLEWGFDPFTPREGKRLVAGAPATQQAAQQSSSDASESDSDAQRKREPKKDNEKEKDISIKKKQKHRNRAAEDDSSDDAARARKEKNKAKEREKERRKDKDKEKEREQYKTKEKDKDRKNRKSSSRTRDREDKQQKERSRSRSKDRRKERDKEKERAKDRSSRSRSKRKDRLEKFKDKISPSRSPDLWKKLLRQDTSLSVRQPRERHKFPTILVAPDEGLYRPEDVPVEPLPGHLAPEGEPKPVAKIIMNIRQNHPKTEDVWQKAANEKMVKKSEADANKMAAVDAVLKRAREFGARKDDPAPAPPPELLRAPPANRETEAFLPLPPRVQVAPVAPPATACAAAAAAPPGAGVGAAPQAPVRAGPGAGPPAGPSGGASLAGPAAGSRPDARAAAAEEAIAQIAAAATVSAAATASTAAAPAPQLAAAAPPPVVAAAAVQAQAASAVQPATAPAAACGTACGAAGDVAGAAGGADAPQAPVPKPKGPPPRERAAEEEEMEISHPEAAPTKAFDAEETLPTNFPFPKGYPPPPEQEQALPTNFPFPKGYPPQPEQEQALLTNFPFPEGYPPPPEQAEGSLPSNFPFPKGFPPPPEKGEEGLPANFPFPEGYPPPPEGGGQAAGGALPANFAFPQGYPPPPGEGQGLPSANLPANFPFPKGYPPPPEAVAAAGGLPPPMFLPPPPGDPGAPPLMMMPPPPGAPPGMPPLLIPQGGTLPGFPMMPPAPGDPNAQLLPPPLMLPQVPGLAAAAALPPPGAMEAVDRWLKENRADQRATLALRTLPIEVQFKVLGEGPLSGANPSAVLTARVRKYEGLAKSSAAAAVAAGAAAAAAAAPGQSLCEGTAAASTAAGFAAAVPATAGTRLPAMTHGLLPGMAGLPGCLPSMLPPGTTGMTGLLAPGMSPAGRAAGAAAALGTVGATRKAGSAPPLAGGAPQIGPTMPPQGELPLGSSEANFIRQHSFDPGAEAAFRNQREGVRRQVMAEGPIAGNNPSAMLMARIRKVETSLSSTPSNVVAAFVQENRLDLSAENALRALPADAQTKVLSEGPLVGSNPSAVLISRIRKVT